MRLGAKNILNGNPKEMINELKEDKHSKEKMKFLKEASRVAKKNKK